MEAYKTETTVREGGSVTLEGLPFSTGERVEVIVLPVTEGLKRGQRYPLRGTPYRYEEPLAPVAEAEWEAAR